MALLNQSVMVYAQLEKLFTTLRQGQAPQKFTREFLKDIGFTSSNHHAFIPLLKGLGFLSADGSPTQRYKEFLDPTRWRKVLAEAIREAYGDIFVLKSKPTKSDRELVTGKYKSTYNLSEVAADRAARTFLALLELADENHLYAEHPAALPHTSVKPKPEPDAKEEDGTNEPSSMVNRVSKANSSADVGLHYNIQIHLPATKDVEVYNAIFRSLREHLID